MSVLNIQRGFASPEEVKRLIGNRPITVVHAKYVDDPKRDGDYPFWEDIRHPDTGKILHAVKGYCEPSGRDRTCYYAEYSDGKGNSYYYFDSRYYYSNSGIEGQSIAEQLKEDKNSFILNNKAREAQREKFDDFMHDDRSENVEVQQEQANIQPRSRSMTRDFNDPDLFTNNLPGEYHYLQGDHVKMAYGSLQLSDKGIRDNNAQRTVGGDSRLEDDDGGHLIGTRFNGASDERNIEAQNSNLNRSSFKIRENTWEKSLKNGDKVFVNIETPHDTNGARPDAYMGYSITEHPDGTREWDAFSYTNASGKEQDKWNQEILEDEVGETVSANDNNVRKTLSTDNTDLTKREQERKAFDDFMDGDARGLEGKSHERQNTQDQGNTII